MENLKIVGGDTSIAGISKLIYYKHDEKWSPNLYRFLSRKNKYLTNVFQDPKTKRYYIGLLSQDGWFIGTNLISVFCYGGKAETYAYMPKYTAGWHDVTKWFWSKYFEVGKKIYDFPEWKELHENEKLTA
jgi:hypothetical protein